MKYIDAEKLIAEIERRINSWSIRGKHSPVGQGRDTCESRVTELSDLLSFIDSLQQEQPEVDLEKEIDNVIADYSFVKTIDSGGFKTTVLDYAKIARHFYELGLKAKEENK